MVASYHAHLPTYAHLYRCGWLEPAGWRYLRALHNMAELNLCTSRATLETLQQHGIERMMFASPLLGLWLHMPPVGARDEDAEVLADPEVRLMLTGRSGPLVVEIEYRVDQENARAFHGVMQEVQLSRQRNGAYGWSIARDIADPELVDRALSLPDLARLSAPAQPLDPIGTRAASARDGFSSRARSGAGPPPSGTAVRIGTLEGRHRIAPPATCCRWRPPRAAAREQRSPRLGLRPGMTKPNH